MARDAISYPPDVRASGLHVHVLQGLFLCVWVFQRYYTSGIPLTLKSGISVFARTSFFTIHFFNFIFSHFPIEKVFNPEKEEYFDLFQ